jgi:tRNA-specific 2-thiouridylase
MKAVLLLSGGLDSTVAAKVMLEQNIDLVAVNFVTPFCTCTRKGCRSEARKVAENFNISIHVIHADEEYIDLVRYPKHGRGKNMNPCIDCRIFFFSRARGFMEEVGARFVVTGEVLGERPMSQHRDALRLIEKESGLRGLILRPLSARLLEPSIPEQRGWVNREQLLAIRGRSRKQQIALAEEFGIVDYPCPAGGCRLTDPQFARRIRESFDHDETSIRHINLLKYGRHFRLPSGAKVVVGRDEGENAVLETLPPASGYLFTCAEDAEGPVTVLFGCRGVDDFHTAAALTLRYSDFKGLRGKVLMRACNDKQERLYEVESMPEKVCMQYQIL